MSVLKFMSKLALRVCLLIYIVLILFMMAHSLQAAPQFKTITNSKLKKIAKHTHALYHIGGGRYCSSSAVKYRNKSYTLTNAHCCAVDAGFGEGRIFVGSHIETILYVSPIADVCVATSQDKKTTLKLAKKEVELLDEVLLLGYPRGEDLTPRYGHVIALNRPVTVDYGDFFHTQFANLISTLTFPGNSGSPVFNSKGEIVNLLYAGPHPLMGYGVVVPLRFIKDALEKAYLIHDQK